MDYCTSYQYRNTSHIYNKHWSSTWTRIWGLKSATTGIYIFFNSVIYATFRNQVFLPWIFVTELHIYIYLFLAFYLYHTRDEGDSERLDGSTSAIRMSRRLGALHRRCSAFAQACCGYGYGCGWWRIRHCNVNF